MKITAVVGMYMSVLIAFGAFLSVYVSYVNGMFGFIYMLALMSPVIVFAICWLAWASMYLWKESYK